MEDDMLKSQFEDLLDGYDQGNISRRSLMSKLAKLTTASIVFSGISANMGARSVDAASNNDVTHSRVDDPGRKVILERILNHKFEFLDASPTTDKDRNRVRLLTGHGHAAFDNAHEHQAWLFGDLDPTGNNDSDKNYYVGDGLRDYDARGSRNDKASTKITRNGHSGSDFRNAEARRNLHDNRLASDKKNQTKKGLDVFQLGYSYPRQDGRSEWESGPAYDYQDLYGLVKLKLKYVCDHCRTHQLVHLLSFLGGMGDPVRQAIIDVMTTELWNTDFRMNAEGWDNDLEEFDTREDDRGIRMNDVNNRRHNPNYNPISNSDWEIISGSISGVSEQDLEKALVQSHGDY